LAFTDHHAAEKLRELREAAGYNSAEALASAIGLAAHKADWGKRGTVDAWTIRKIEQGHVPGPRIRFVLASYFECEQNAIWEPRNWKPVERSIATSRKAVSA